MKSGLYRGQGWTVTGNCSAPVDWSEQWISSSVGVDHGPWKYSTSLALLDFFYYMLLFMNACSIKNKISSIHDVSLVHTSGIVWTKDWSWLWNGENRGQMWIVDCSAQYTEVGNMHHGYNGLFTEVDC